MDSVMIFNRSSWCRFSQGVGGSTIDFLEYFRNMDFVEAVKYLLEFAGYIRTETMQKFQPERQTEKIEETKQRKDIPKEPFLPKNQSSALTASAVLSDSHITGGWFLIMQSLWV